MNEQQGEPRYAQKLPDELIRNCRLLAEREDILKFIPKNKVFCEVGVALGDFSQKVLTVCEVSKFYAVDSFGWHNAPDVWGGRVGRELNGKSHVDYYRDKFKEYIERGIVEILKGGSVQVLTKLPEKSIDILYLDADHSYSSVKGELNAAKPLLTPNAWIILNDYIMHDWVTNKRYGVVQAAHEFMIEGRWEMIYFALHNGMFCDVAIRKLK
jgi:hypothetical protein